MPEMLDDRSRMATPFDESSLALVRKFLRREFRDCLSSGLHRIQ
jgi:hypothetical protein